MSDSKTKSQMITELQSHITNLSGSILAIVEFWETEMMGMEIPPQCTAFDARMKFYRKLFDEAQRVTTSSAKVK
jgi:hypothetical protein